MVYSDLIFILGLFPLAAILSFLDRSAEYKNLILIVTSLLFFSWGKPFALCLIFLSVIIDWSAGIIIDKHKDNKAVCGVCLGVDLLVNCALLIIFGHNYVLKGMKIKALTLSSTVIPLGMAFYTLRGFSYVYDVFKGNVKHEKNILCLLTYMVSFHLMLVGPAVRYGDIEPQLRKRTVTASRLNDGIIKIMTGLGKAVILASAFAELEKAGLGGKITVVGGLVGMISFFGEYYFLFTGFVDIARGMGYVGGFDYPENYGAIKSKELFTGVVKSFNTTVVDFFADVCGLKNEKARKGAVTFVLYILCGVMISLWYNMKLNFLIVGCVAAVLVACEKLLLSKALVKLPAVLRGLYVFVVTMLIFGGLRYDSFGGYVKWLKGVFGAGGFAGSSSLNKLMLQNILLIVISLFLVIKPLGKMVLRCTDKISAHSATAYGTVRIIKIVLSAAVFLLAIVTLIAENAVN